MIWSKLCNPWSWSPGANDEYTRVLKEAYQAGYAEGAKQGYATGVAHGELMGRLALAGELERCFNPDAREALTAESAERVRLRQVH